MWSPVTATTTAKNRIENGKPNRKRILVAPQVPSGLVSDRCIALRATWPSAAMTVKRIQRLAMVNMWKWVGGPMIAAKVPPGLKQVNHAHVIGAMLSQTQSSSWTSEAQIQDPLAPGVVRRRLVVISFRLTRPWGNGSWLSPGRRMFESGAASHHAFRDHHVV